MRSTRLPFLLAMLWLATTGTQALPLWEVEGTSNRMYLLGSIHFLRAQDYPLPTAITDALADVDVVVMELDLSAVDPLEMQVTMLSLASDPQGRTLETLLGARTYRKARELAAEIDIDLTIMQPFEPWYATLQITQLRLMQLGFDGSYGVETQLFLQATQLGKKIEGLETLEAQLAMMDSLPLKTQKRFLIMTLEQIAVLDGKMDGIVNAWRSGDTHALQRDLMDEFRLEPKLYEQMIVQRNANWVESILDMIDDRQNYLIVVGALHLVGDDSIQRMLADKGYSTRQIKE